MDRDIGSMPRGSQVGSGNKEQHQLNMWTRVCKVMTAIRRLCSQAARPRAPLAALSLRAQRCHQPRSESTESEAQATGSPPLLRAHHTHRQKSNLRTQESYFQLHLPASTLLKKTLKLGHANFQRDQL